MQSSPASRAFGVGNLAAAAVVLFGVFLGLPSRWLPVDAGAVLVGGALAASGVGLLARTRWAATVARVAALGVLAVGLFLGVVLAVTASYLNGVYGPVGRGGAIILVLVLALALPYLVILPSAQLLWLGPRARREREKSAAAKADGEPAAP